MNPLLAERLRNSSAQQLFDGALGPRDAELVRLLSKARDITGGLPGSAVANALNGHVASALALAEQMKAGRS